VDPVAVAGRRTITRAAARDKGTRWNKAIATYLVGCGWPYAEPRAKNGAKDRGDVTGVAGVMIEAKNTTRPRLGQWMAEVQAQTANAEALVGVCWMKRAGSTHAADGVVVATMATVVTLGYDGGLAADLRLSQVLADPKQPPPDRVVLLKGGGCAAMRGDLFVRLLRDGGW